MYHRAVPGVSETISAVPERTLRSLFIALSQRRALGRLATGLPLTRPMVRRFVAGETLDEALAALERLHAAGFVHDRRRPRRIGHLARISRRRRPSRYLETLRRASPARASTATSA